MENIQTQVKASSSVEQALKKQKIMKVVQKIIVYTFLVIMGISTIFPFYWMINISLQTYTEYVNSSLSPVYFPTSMEFSNYANAMQVTNFWNNLKNTFVVGIVSTGLSMIVIILAAFAFARLEFKGKELLFTALLSTMMIPGELFQISNYATVSKLGWNNSYTVLIVPFLVSVFYIYLLRNAFRQIPDSLYYAAKVDGTSDMKYLVKVMIPLSGPTIISIIILKVMGSWNSYIWPRLVNRTEWRLISNWLTNAFNNEDTGMVDYPKKMAGVVIVSLPLIILFIFFRKYIMRGVSKSGIKG